MNNLHLFFHQDFDGICSGAIFLAYASLEGFGESAQAELVPVDYNLKPTWALTNLSRPSAVVDFLYHPQADWWFDHHPTTFLKAEWEHSFRADAQHVWNTKYKSCPALILDSVSQERIRTELKGRFGEHIEWSEIIDRAEYASPEQVVEASEPALQINLSLAAASEARYSRFLVRCLQVNSLSDVANLEEVAVRYRRAMKWQQDAISYMSKAGELRNGVAFFDLTGRGDLFQRYAAYYLWPETRFTVAVYGNGQSYRITVGSNPWLPFKGPNLGSLCEGYGGGGHTEVGAIAVSGKSKALRIGRKIASILRGESPYIEQLPFRPAPVRQHR